MYNLPPVGFVINSAVGTRRKTSEINAIWNSRDRIQRQLGNQNHKYAPGTPSRKANTSQEPINNAGGRPKFPSSLWPWILVKLRGSESALAASVTTAPGAGPRYSDRGGKVHAFINVFAVLLINCIRVLYEVDVRYMAGRSRHSPDHDE